MRYRDIRVGMVLKLKKERQEAYGADSDRVEVTDIRPRPGYRIPWIFSGTDAYKPQDFEKALH